MKQYNPYARAILQVLNNARRPLSTQDVARFARIGPTTAMHHLRKLVTYDDTVICERKGNGYYWSLRDYTPFKVWTGWLIMKPYGGDGYSIQPKEECQTVFDEEMIGFEGFVGKKVRITIEELQESE